MHTYQGRRFQEKASNKISLTSTACYNIDIIITLINIIQNYAVILQHHIKEFF